MALSEVLLIFVNTKYWVLEDEAGEKEEEESILVAVNICEYQEYFLLVEGNNFKPTWK